MIYDGMALPQRRLYLSWPRNRDGGEVRPAAFVERLQKLLPGVSVAEPEGNRWPLAPPVSYTHLPPALPVRRGDHSRVPGPGGCRRDPQSGPQGRKDSLPAGGGRGPLSPDYPAPDVYKRQMYIIAGKKKLEACRTGELAELRKKAEQSGAQEDAQAYNDYANLVERFEKKISDLELTRMISIQMGPQTRLLQNNDTLMIEKIQTSLVNTIPLWKSQMVLALGLERSRQATASQSAVTNMTNELLKKNSEMLKMGTIATAKEAERGIVDIETLRKTNEDLISTLDEVMQIQSDGRRKRAEAEVELGKIEGELRQKLLELKH